MSICKKLSKSAMRCSTGLEGLPAVVEKIRELFGDRDMVVFLHGDLAAGKTTFVQHFASKKAVTSPTFSLQNCYGDGVYHYDLYTIDTQKFMHSGLIYELEKEGIHFIEWAPESLQSFIEEAGFATASIRIEGKNDTREYLIDVA